MSCHRAVAAGRHPESGICALSASHASGYAHPEIAVTAGVLSALSNHPLPTLAVTLALKDGGGSVDSVPVAVYYGSAVTLPAR